MRAHEFIQLENQSTDEGIKGKIAAGVLGATLGLGTPGEVKHPEFIPKPAPIQQVVQQGIKLLTNNPIEQVLRDTAIKAGLVGVELAAFMAQCAHETGNFRDTGMIEKLHPAPHKKQKTIKHYTRKKSLGNKNAAEAERYIARGFIGLTGKFNYEYFGKIIGVDLVNNPELASQPDIAAKIAVAFWKERIQRKVKDFNDVAAVTKPINSGLSHLQDRMKKFQAYKAAIISPQTQPNVRPQVANSPANSLMP